MTLSPIDRRSVTTHPFANFCDATGPVLRCAEHGYHFADGDICIDAASAVDQTDPARAEHAGTGVAWHRMHVKPQERAPRVP
ncbi:MAG: hypothetical protein EHM16_05265 [Betaproteobacteria bacterium]|nr:MAG: hypothetical protein EHM16_05265 [Betaproteobacteria bacterium]